MVKHQRLDEVVERRRLNLVANRLAAWQEPQETSSLSTNPETAFAILDQRSHGYLVLQLPQIQLDATKGRLTTRLIQAKESTVGAGPNLPGVVFIQDVHAIGSRLVTHRIHREQIADSGLFIPHRGGIEAGHSAAIGRYPIDSAPGLEQVVNNRMGQTLFDAIVGEFIAVEATQPVTGAEPEKTMRVRDNAEDEIARQTVGSRVGSHRELLGRDACRAEK